MKNTLKRCLCLLLAWLLLASSYPVVHAAGYSDGYPGGMAGDDSGILARGVDISTWQGHDVDFNKIKAQGYSFVILRAGFATTKDDTFEKNYTRAKAAGLHVGVYLYSYAENREEAIKEAEALLGWLAGKQLEYPVYFDVEDPKIHAPMSVEALTELAMAFLDRVAMAGWLVGLYSSRSWLTSKLDTDRICARYECWLAQYLADGTCDTYDKYDGICGMWQYSCSGSVEGIPGDVDMNVCFKNYPAICRQYGFSGYSASGASLILTGASAPAVLMFGEHMSVTGRITSTSGNLTDVSVGFYKENGERAAVRSIGPKATVCDLSTLNESIRSQELPEGRYEYRITATNTNETQVLYHTIVVVSKYGVRMDDAAVPENLKAGETFQTGGTVFCDTEFASVTLTVKQKETVVLQTSVQQPGTRLDLQTLSGEMKFETLAPGEYTYRIDAVTSRGNVTFLNQSFRVWVKDDPITVSELSLKTEYYPGDEVAITGTVTSAKSDMESFSIEILDNTGKVIAAAQTDKPVRSLSLGDFSDTLRLGTLEIGVYTCTIRAQNSGGPKTVLNQKFFLRPDAISLCEARVPTVLEKGESFCLQGVIASDATALKFVSVTVSDVNDRVHLSAAAVPGGNSFDLSSLNDDLIFSRLMVNDYTLRITARNGHNATTLYEATLEVTEHGDLIRWSDGCAAPTGIAYSPNSALSLWGELVSDTSEISRVDAVIYTAGEGRMMASAKLLPGRRTVQVDSLNQVLRFSALSAGEYRFVITAANGSGEYVMLDAPFFVSECLHSNVVSGAVYGAVCTADGAVCDSRCLNCGAKVYGGTRLPHIAHTYRDGICTGCGRGEFMLVSAQKTDVLPDRGGRIVIAASDGSNWYALGSDGKAVAISAPDAAGRIAVSAELLWTPELQRDGSVVLRNVYGRLLHLDPSGLVVCRGISHTRLMLALHAQQMSISCSGDSQRWLSCSRGSFGVSGTEAKVVVFSYIPPESSGGDLTR